MNRHTHTRAKTKPPPPFSPRTISNNYVTHIAWYFHDKQLYRRFRQKKHRSDAGTIIGKIARDPCRSLFSPPAKASCLQAGTRGPLPEGPESHHAPVGHHGKLKITSVRRDDNETEPGENEHMQRHAKLARDVTNRNIFQLKWKENR